jgi:hypothetical protein
MDLMYKSPTAWFTFVRSNFDYKAADADVGGFLENKATRNAHEHTDGLATPRYLEDVAKGNGQLRAKVGDPLPVDPLYLDRAIALIERLIADIGAAAEATAAKPPAT